MTMLMHHMLRAAAGYAAPAPASTDPQFNYVSLLLNDTGTNGQQNNTFLDSSSNNFTITRNGTPTQGSVTPYWPDGQWSNYFGGTGNYLSFTGTNAAFQFGTGDWTVECWVCPAVISTDNYVWDFRPTSNGAYPSLNASSTGFKYVANSAVRITSTTTPKVGVWYHIAVSRSGTSTKLFVNGVQEGATYSDSTNYIVAANRPYIGIDSFGAATPFTGYISNVRMVKGTALYTTNFTPSTTPLTAVSGTSLLTCQSNRFKDNSSNNFAITVTGTPTVQAFEPFSPASSYATSVGGSGYFSGTSQYLSAGSAGASLAFGTGDFTIEAWVYPTAIKAQRIYDGRDGSNGFFPTLGMIVGGAFTYFNNGLTRITSTTLAKANNWYHVAVCRSGTSTRLFINGVQEGSTYTDSSNYLTTVSSPYIGVDGILFGTNAWAGYISNLRAIKGTAVYTSTFTPPTSPVTAITGTSLLLNFTNAGIYDAATLNDLVTVGNAQVSTAQAKFGSSSMYFDGTGDWLTFIDSPVARLETGDFTIEGWLYLPLLGTARGIVSKGTSTTGWSVGVNLLNQFTFAYTTSTLTAATALTMGQWVHFAVVRNGSATGNVKIYFNGVLDATSGGAVTDNFNQTSIGYVGADRVGTSPMNGYIEDLRITKGYARYTANFTPPTAPFPTR